MNDNQAAQLVELLTHISDQLKAERQHRLQLEDMVLNSVRLTSANNNLLIELIRR